MIKDLLQGKPLRHPLHPLLIHFPISLFILGLLFDVAWLLGWNRAIMVTAAQYALSVGIVAALVAAVPGFADYSGIRVDDRAKKIATGHMILNLLAVTLYAVSVWLRYRGGADSTPSGWAVLFSTAGFLVLGVSGYLGGKLIYELGIAVGRQRRKKPAPRRTIRAGVESDGYASVGPAAELGEGETLRVDADGTVLAVTRLDGGYYAFQEYCTHRYGPMSEGEFRDGQVVCPWHRSCFDVRTGKVTDGPAKVDLRTFEVQVSGNGVLRVKVA